LASRADVDLGREAQQILAHPGDALLREARHEQGDLAPIRGYARFLRLGLARLLPRGFALNGEQRAQYGEDEHGTESGCSSHDTTFFQRTRAVSADLYDRQARHLPASVCRRTRSVLDGRREER